MVIRDAIKAKRHPQGPNSTGSWRGDAKAKVPGARLLGVKPQPDYAEQARNHHSMPLSTLKDPDSFGPPPKHINYHGAVAAPTTTTPDRRGWGAPLPQEQVKALTQRAEVQEEPEEYKPPVPYRADTTGLSTTGLPKPPTHRALLEPREEVDTGLWRAPPVPGSRPQPRQQAVSQPKPQAKPQPPPRLPPRQNSQPDVNAPSPPPTYSAAVEPQERSQQAGYLNTKAVNSLSNAGVAVPGFGIGQSVSPQQSGPSSPSTNGHPSQMNELQSRFARMNGGTSGDAQPASQGTTWAQKQAALKTATAFKQDPSTVSLSDARSAASTANNFRQRHGEQIAAGAQAANGVNQKYGLADKARGWASEADGSTNVAAAAAAKRAPPPPPKKKELAGTPQHSDEAPPPVPLSSKPTF